MKNDYIRYPEDVKKLQHALVDEEITLPPDAISNLYDDYSEDVWAAGWINLSEDTISGFISWLKERL